MESGERHLTFPKAKFSKRLVGSWEGSCCICWVLTLIEKKSPITTASALEEELVSWCQLSHCLKHRGTMRIVNCTLRARKPRHCSYYELLGEEVARRGEVNTANTGKCCGEVGS